MKNLITILLIAWTVNSYSQDYILANGTDTVWITTDEFSDTTDWFISDSISCIFIDTAHREEVVFVDIEYYGGVWVIYNEKLITITKDDFSENNQQFKLAFYYKNNPKEVFYGKWQNDYTLTYDWVKFLNIKYPDTYHFIERKIK